MKVDEIKYSLQNLIHRKMRSLLTVLSILIGIMAIFTLMSFGLGIRDYMDTLSEEAGADKLFIQAKGIGAPGTDANFFLTKDDVDFVKKINGVKEISGMYMRVGEIKHKKERKFVFVAGYDISKKEFVEEVFTVDIVKGRQLKKGDLDKVVLGYNYQFENKVFKKPLKLGDKIEINGKYFNVIGFYEEIGNPQDDSNVYLTYEAMESLYNDIKDKFGYVFLKAEKSFNPEELADKIEEKLRKHKGQEEGKENFFVQTFSDILATFGTIINILNGILVLIALVSVVVASVNIMNTMYTAVLERTKEIGIMKAIGARNSDVLAIFIFESGFLGMIGGIIGVVLGYIISSIGGKIAASAGFSMLRPIFPWYLIVGCILFAFSVGAGSGILPAFQASKLRPVDALRYE
jgi:putative ABC transport system permease protein